MGASSVVFVGGGFRRQLFEEHELFPERMAKDYTAVGDFAIYAYGSNTYRFSVLNDRIVLDHNSGSVLSGELVEAAARVVAQLEAQSQGHGVTGLGFNFSAVLSQGIGGLSGTEFCNGMYDAVRVRQAIGSPFDETQCHVVVLRGAVQYTLRVEPHVSSGGANLFLSVNGHQNVAASDDLSSKLNEAGNAKEYIQSVFSGLSRGFEGEGK
ncbi:MAG: hypothetical protein OXI22_09575 [Defluviicoccus sp.]|nr:hypothetical protein [Defluviicoccus sp.]MDE0384122.1 hypothetical protein [Defluviicoccus sp.]